MNKPYESIDRTERRIKRGRLRDWWANREKGQFVKRLGKLAGIVLGGMFGTGWIGWVIAAILVGLAGIVAMKLL